MRASRSGAVRLLEPAGGGAEQELDRGSEAVEHRAGPLERLSHRAGLHAALALLALLGATMAMLAALGAAPARAEGETTITTSPEQLREAVYAAEVAPTLLLPEESKQPGVPSAEEQLILLEALEGIEERDPIGGASAQSPARAVPAAGGAAREAAFNGVFERYDKFIGERAKALGFQRNVLSDIEGAQYKTLGSMKAQVDGLLREDVFKLSPAERQAAMELQQQLNDLARMDLEAGDQAARGQFNPNSNLVRGEANPIPALLDDAKDAQADPAFAQVQQSAGIYADFQPNQPELRMVGNLDPAAQAAVAADAPGGGGVNASASEMNGQRSQAIANMQVAGEQANGAAHDVAGGGAVQPAVVAQQQAASELADDDEVTTFEDASEIVESGKVSVAAEKAIPIADRAVATSMTTALGTGLNVGASALDPLLIANLASQAPQLITTMIDLLSGTPSFEELVLQQLAAIQKQIHELSEQVREGLTQVDSYLRGIDTTLKEDSLLLEHMGEHIGQLSEEMGQVEDKLDQIQADIYRIAATQREENLQAALNTDLGYSTRTGGDELPQYQFEQAAGLFYTWGASDPFNAISENPREDWSTTPSGVFAQLGNAADTNALDFNLDYLISYANERGWSPEQEERHFLPAGLPNPEVWAAGATAYSQLLVENPQLVTEVQHDELNELIGEGSGLSTTMQELTHGGEHYAPSSVDGVTLDTDSSILDGALANYLQLATATDEPSFLNRLQAQENYALSELDPAKGEATCESCHLGVAPSGGTTSLGEALINPWQGPEQEPSEQLTGLEGTTDPNRKGEAGVAKRGEANSCEPALVAGADGYEPEEEPRLLRMEQINPLPNVYSNAWHLGVGHLMTCYTTKWNDRFNIDHPDENSLAVQFTWWWYTPSRAKPEIAMRIEVNTPDEQLCPHEEKKSGEFLEDIWLPANACNHESLQGLFYAIAGHIHKLAPPQTLDTAACHSLLETVSPIYSSAGYTCSLYYPSPEDVANTGPGEDLTADVESALRAVQSDIYRSIAPEGESAEFTRSGANVQAAATRLDGARALVDDLIELGMPDSMGEDPQLRSLVLGPSHLPDNSPSDFELYELLQSYHGSTNPAAPGGAIEALVKQRTQELDSQLHGDLSAPAAEGGEQDPLLQETLARLELTESVLEAAPQSEKAPQISGEPEVGEVLTCEPGEWKAGAEPSFSYRWLRGDSVIASGSSYTVESADVGSELACEVIAEDQQGETSAKSEGVEVKPAPSLMIADEQELAGSHAGFTEDELTATLGQLVDYRITVRNSGNVSLVLSNFSDVSCANLAGGPGQGELAPAQSTVYTCERAINRSGTYLNEASVEGVPPTGLGFPLTRASNELIVLGPNPSPTVQGGTASEIGQRAAIAQASVDPRGGHVTSCAFEYGRAIPYVSAPCSKLPGAVDEAVEVSARLGGLAPGATYHFRILAGSASGSSRGPEATFTTLPAAAPTAETGRASQVGQRTALLSASVDPNGAAVTSCTFQYGAKSLMSVPCSTSPGSGTAATTVTATVSGLSPNTSYRFRVLAVSASGTGDGAYGAFSTMVALAPTVQTNAPSEVTEHTAIVNASVNPNGGKVSVCEVQYGTSTLGHVAPCASSPGAGTSAVAIAVKLTALAANTTYHFRVIAGGQSGTTTGAEESFRT